MAGLLTVSGIVSFSFRRNKQFSAEYSTLGIGFDDSRLDFSSKAISASDGCPVSVRGTVNFFQKPSAFYLHCTAYLRFSEMSAGILSLLVSIT